MWVQMGGSDNHRPTDEATTTDEASGAWTRRTALQTLVAAGVGGLPTAIAGTTEATAERGRRAGQAGWGQQAKLVANDGDAVDRFGLSVAVDGSTAVVSAPRDEDPNGDRAGSAYVFAVGASSTATATPTRTATDTAPDDENAAEETPQESAEETSEGTTEGSTKETTENITDGFGPGLGVASTVAGIIGTGYLLRRRPSGSDD